MVLFPKTDPCPKLELWPNDVDVLTPNKFEPVLLAVLALFEPKENELALLAVAVPKRPPPVVALLEPNPDWPNEKPLAVPLLLASWPKPLDWPNTGFPNPLPEDVPNPGEPNTVDTGAAGAEGAEDTGGAAGWPNTVLVAVLVATAAAAAADVVAAAAVVVVVSVLLATAGVGVVSAGATVLITGVTFKELLSVVGGCVNMEPGFSELST